MLISRFKHIGYIKYIRMMSTEDPKIAVKSGKPHPLFLHNVWITAAVFTVFAFFFFLYVYYENKLNETYTKRHISYMLVNELHMSTDDMATMAHYYIVTHNPIYQRRYQEIYDIRSGKSPRLRTYDYFYWELPSEHEADAIPERDESVSLIELMHRAGFSDRELSAVAEAMKLADSIVELERKAMKTADTDPARAGSMLHDEHYNRLRSSLHEPIS